MYLKCYCDFINPVYLPSIMWKPDPRYNYLYLQTNNYSRLDVNSKVNTLNKNNFIRTGLRGK